MIDDKDYARNLAQNGNLAQNEDSFATGSLSKSLTLGKEGVSKLSDLKEGLIKLVNLDGLTFFITKKDSSISVFLQRQTGAVMINSIDIDSGIQTLKSTNSDVLLVSSTGQEYSLINEVFNISKAKENRTQIRKNEGMLLAS